MLAPPTPPTTHTLLLVDDDPEHLAALAGLVVGAGYEAVAAQSGRQALHYLTSNQEPAAIIMDLSMPDMSGWEFINILRAYVALSLIPIVVVSDVETSRGGTTAVTHWFTKPVEPESFLAAVKRCSDDRVRAK